MELARGRGVSLRSVLLAAHVKALSVMTGQREVMTGLVLNGRPERAGGDQLLGLFLNTVPLRVQLEPCSWRELIERIFAREQEELCCEPE